MNETNNRDRFMRMARGAFEERVDYEMDKVIQNILDPTPKATAKRKITLTIELTPDDERRQIQVSVTTKSTLAATNPVATSLYVTGDSNGELVVAEMVPQVPGQLNIADYFNTNLADLIEAGKVVIMQQGHRPGGLRPARPSRKEQAHGTHDP